MKKVVGCKRGESALRKIRGGWGRQTRWILTLECGHVVEKLAPMGQRVEKRPTRAQCDKCFEATLAEKERR